MRAKTQIKRCVVAFIAVLIFVSLPVHAKKGSKSRFYDFSDQLINGEIKKPATIYVEARARAKFARLLRLKKSFRSALILTGYESILK